MAPIGVHSTDEIGQVARAFDQVHREAVRLAADEARLRGSVSSMLVSLSRRSQSLLERLLRQIDTLEQGEQDPDRLASLFRMDHLATRMRRHSENLLVLAGHDPARRQALPVSLIDVARAAISEIEQYDRVTLQVQSGVSVTGAAVNDTVHLLAELLENATVFSARSAPVLVSGSLHTSGGVLMSISDSGMGMTEEILGQLNWRLENPPAADAAVSRHMGLFAVAHLAARHGIRVRLQRPPSGGLMAHVWLPGELVARDTVPAPWPPPRPPAPASPAPPRRGLSDTMPPGSIRPVPAAPAGMPPAGVSAAGAAPAAAPAASWQAAAPVPAGRAPPPRCRGPAPRAGARVLRDAADLRGGGVRLVPRSRPPPAESGIRAACRAAAGRAGRPPDGPDGRQRRRPLPRAGLGRRRRPRLAGGRGRAGPGDRRNHGGRAAPAHPAGQPGPRHGRGAGRPPGPAARAA